MRFQSSDCCDDWCKGYGNNRSPKNWRMISKSAVRHVLEQIYLKY